MKVIDPIFKEMGISFENNLPEDAIDVPIDHPAYKDIWRRIDNYTDKVFLARQFEIDEQKESGFSNDEVQEKYDFLNNLLIINEKIKKESSNGRDGLFKIFNHIIYSEKYIEKVDKAQMPESLVKMELEDKLKEDKNLKDYISNEIIDYLFKNFFRKQVTEQDIIHELTPINNQLNNKFSEAIKKRYPESFKEGNRIKLEKPDTARMIIEDKKKIREDFQNMLPGINYQKFAILIKNAYNTTEGIKTHITRELEKFYGLRFNKKNGLFYFSDGEGMYVPFNADNLGKTFKKVVDRFFIKVKEKDKKTKEERIIDKQYYWTKSEFFKLASEYCIVEVESEKNIIAFPNCAYDIKERKIYDLDYRLPRLPIKQCEVNFIYHKDLNEQGGALKEIFDYCFDEYTKNRIFQHYGKALFERGYTESQDSLFLMGKGNVGKTTFLESLNMIFKNRKLLNAGDFNSNNEFKFGPLAEAEIILLDEISNANKKIFLEILKLWTGGGESIMCNPKFGRMIQLDSEYVPRMVGTGNNLSQEVYEGAQGVGVLRRFDILFLKHSILEAKRLTVEIQGKEYPACQKEKETYIILEPTEYTEDKEAIGIAYKFIDGHFIEQFDKDGKPLVIKQGRTYFNQNELRTSETLEWFLQQVILNYRPDVKKQIDEDRLREAFLKAYCPEAWVIKKHVEPHYIETYDFPQLDDSIVISAEELLDKIREVIDENMLEKSISNPNSKEFKEILEKTLEINESFDKIEKGKKYFYGISFQ